MTDVLVVEDHEKIREVFVDTLESLGYIASSANCVDDALEKISVKKPDLIMSDIKMPGKDGYDLINSLPDFDYHGPVILITAESNIYYNQINYDGKVLVMTKPIEKQKLYETIESVVNNIESKEEK